VAQQHDMAGIDAKGARRSFHSRVEWKPSWDSRKATPGTRRWAAAGVAGGCWSVMASNVAARNRFWL
jgi:hypothetical protein